MTSRAATPLDKNGGLDERAALHHASNKNPSKRKFIVSPKNLIRWDGGNMTIKLMDESILSKAYREKVLTKIIDLPCMPEV